MKSSYNSHFIQNRFQKKTRRHTTSTRTTLVTIEDGSKVCFVFVPRFFVSCHDKSCRPSIEFQESGSFVSTFRLVLCYSFACWWFFLCCKYEKMLKGNRQPTKKVLLSKKKEAGKLAAAQRSKPRQQKSRYVFKNPPHVPWEHFLKVEL